MPPKQTDESEKEAEKRKANELRQLMAQVIILLIVKLSSVPHQLLAVVLVTVNRIVLILRIVHILKSLVNELFVYN